MQEDKICSFFGHRDIKITEELYATATAEILKSLDFGCRTFYFGGFGDFDRLCHGIISDIAKKQPCLKVKRVYCVSQPRYLTKTSPYFKHKDYDEVIYLAPSFDGWRRSIYFRNCAMVDKSDYIIFYVESRENSGAFKTYRYAQARSGKEIINIFS